MSFAENPWSLNKQPSQDVPNIPTDVNTGGKSMWADGDTQLSSEWLDFFEQFPCFDFADTRTINHLSGACASEMPVFTLAMILTSSLSLRGTWYFFPFSREKKKVTIFFLDAYA